MPELGYAQGFGVQEGEAMNDELIADDWNMIIQSLEHTRQKFRDYTGYPSPEFKQQQIDAVTALLKKVRTAKKGAKVTA